MKTIAVVEDEKNLNNLITTYLEKEGYKVISYYNGESAIISKEKIDLWILDIMLGDNINGYDIIKKIKNEDNNIPVIFTTARDQELDKIVGLELDADDYITKPYSTKELVLRVNKLIKRVYEKEVKKINYQNYIVNLDKRTVFNKEREIILTTLEFDLLEVFLNNIGRTFSREDIINIIWGDNYYGNNRVVDDLIRRLRQKLKELNINTIYGYGYRLV